MNADIAELQSTFLKVLNRLDGMPRTPVTVQGMALPMGVGSAPPNRIMVFPLGEPPSPPQDGRKWKFTKEDLARAKNVFDERTDPMPILYEHGDDPVKGKKAAGWVDSVDLASDGLYANVRWTDEARAEIRAGEWGFRSPGWEGEEDPLGFIYAGPLNEMSLVNRPAIGGMPPITASSQPSTQHEPITAPSQAATTEEVMAEATTITAAKKTAALDKAGILEAIKAKYPGSDVFGDETLAGLIADALSGAATLETPAVPSAFAGAEDGVKSKVAGATAPVQTDESDELKKAQEQFAMLQAQYRALEARELSGRIVNASAADRKSMPPKTFAERIREQRLAGARS